jgi:hypothetical protein
MRVFFLRGTVKFWREDKQVSKYFIQHFGFLKERLLNPTPSKPLNHRYLF